MKQAEKKVSLFACDEAAVYGDVAVDSKYLTMTKVQDNDFHFAQRKHMATWINTGQAIATKGDFVDSDWSVKVDADAVILD